MKIIFMGTTNFALAILKKVVNNGYNVVAVYTQPPRPAGRGKNIQLGPVGKFAEQSKMQLRYPSHFSDSNEVEKFQNFNADLVLVAAYGLILPQNILESAKLGFFNIHASLLPRWRGAAPIQRALLAGDSETGISLIRLVTDLDAGPIVLQQSLKISYKDNAGMVHDKLSEIGAGLTLKLCANYDQMEFQDQCNSGISYARKIKKCETKIDWNSSAVDVMNKVRAFSPSPGAWFELNGERIKIFKCTVLDLGGPIGHLSLGPLRINCKTGSIKPLLLQRAGRNVVTADDFLRGYKRLDGKTAF